MLCVTISWLVSYSLNMSNEQPSYDGLFIDSTVDTDWQIQQGRFCQPLYWQLRGFITSPPLLNALAIIYLSVTCFCIIRLLKISTSPVYLALVAITLSVNPANALLNASYTAWIDAFQLAFMPSALAVLLLFRTDLNPGIRLTLSVLLMTISLGLYQVYLSGFAFLALAVFIRLILENAPMKKCLAFILQFVLAGVAALILYYVIWKLVLQATGLMPASYNGYDQLGDYSNTNLVRLAISAYTYPVTYLLHPETFHRTLTGAIYGIAIIAGAIAVLKTALKQRPGYKPFAVIIALLLIPFALGCIYFISKGEFHSLMVQPFYLLTAGSVASFQLYRPDTGSRRSSEAYSCFQCGACVCLTASLIFGMVHANDVAVKRALIYQSTESMMTRMMDRIETTAGYEIGETPILFSGEFSNSPILGERSAALNNTDGIGLPRSSIAPISKTFIRLWMQQKWGYPYIEPSAEVEQRIAGSEELKGMPVFPAVDSVQYIDGVIVVKVSE